MVDALVAAVPQRPRLLRTAARLPPALRSRPLYRAVAAVAHRTPSMDPELDTNLGISSRLRCRVPRTQPVALFGKPTLYAGERASLELAARFAGTADVFLDIGANLGYFTFFVRSRAPRALPIHYFEPDPALYALLERNVRANTLENVAGYNQAIGAVDGAATFFVDRSDSFSGSLTRQFADVHEVIPTTVAVRTFASVAADLGFTHACVKVDIEGAEQQFLDGAAGALGRIGYLVMEVLGPAHAGGFVPALMRAGDLRAYYVNDYTLEHSPDGAFAYRSGEYNWLFCRAAPSALRQLLTGSPFRVESDL